MPNAQASITPRGPAFHTRAAVLSIGDELTLGQTLDTNGRWFAARLVDLGITTVEHVTVPDDLDAQVDALRRLAARTDLLLVSGGLGPTPDDLTREALARATDDVLVEDPVALGQVQSWFASRTRAMPAINRVQALRPARGVSLPNLRGTAPGLHATLASGTGDAPNTCDVFCLPGPPNELIPMFEDQVLPRLRADSGRTVRTRALHTFGIGESDLASRLGPLMDRGRVPLVGTTASGGVVTCRLRYEGPLAPLDADATLDATEADVRAKAAPFVFGDGDDTLPGVVVALLTQRKETVGVVESCTGGLLGWLLTDPSGASACFRGGLLTYDNALKTSLAGVDPALLGPGGPGAVSRETALALALGGLERLDVGHCLAVTGIAGPAGATLGKPVGTVFIALASRGVPEPDVRRFQMAGDRRGVRDWSAKAALVMLHMRLAGTPRVRLLREAENA